MIRRADGLHRTASRFRFRGRRQLRWFVLARAVVLLTLLLLPVQLRAGSADVHPHSLLQLLVDLHDGALDHHEGDDHGGPQGAHRTARGVDFPDFGQSSLGGSVALLAAVVCVPRFPTLRRERTRDTAMPWSGRVPALDPPPPRVSPR